MKVELILNTDELVARITREVVKQLIPVLNGSKDSRDDELKYVKALANYFGVTKQWIYEKDTFKCSAILQSWKISTL